MRSNLPAIYRTQDPNHPIQLEGPPQGNGTKLEDKERKTRRRGSENQRTKHSGNGSSDNNGDAACSIVEHHNQIPQQPLLRSHNHSSAGNPIHPTPLFFFFLFWVSDLVRGNYVEHLRRSRPRPRS